MKHWIDKERVEQSKTEGERESVSARDREIHVTHAFRSGFVLFSCQLENPGRQYWECLEGNKWRRRQKKTVNLYSRLTKMKSRLNAISTSTCHTLKIHYDFSNWRKTTNFFSLTHFLSAWSKLRDSYKPFKSLEVWLLSQMFYSSLNTSALFVNAFFMHMPATSAAHAKIFHFKHINKF